MLLPASLILCLGIPAVNRLVGWIQMKYLSTYGLVVRVCE